MDVWTYGRRWTSLCRYVSRWTSVGGRPSLGGRQVCSKFTLSKHMVSIITLFTDFDYIFIEHTHTHTHTHTHVCRWTSSLGGRL